MLDQTKTINAAGTRSGPQLDYASVAVAKRQRDVLDRFLNLKVNRRREQNVELTLYSILLLALGTVTVFSSQYPAEARGQMLLYDAAFLFFALMLRRRWQRQAMANSKEHANVHRGA